MNRTFFLHFFIFLCLILCGCITEFEPKGIDEVEGILVVEGFITDDESVITLGQSKGITYDDSDRDMTPYRVVDAKVFIECDDGTQWSAANQDLGQYIIQTGKLNPERLYRLKIEHEGHEYRSEFASPMVSSEVDSVFWTKRGSEQPVNIHVATHAPDSTVQYYRWSYREDWQTFAQVIIPERKDLSVMCSKKYSSRDILIGTSEQTASEQLITRIAEISPRDDRFMFLYRIDVTQNVISKRAYNYYTNIKKNAQQTGSLFAHIPSELKGNITCITDPSRPVIGYIDVSSATRGRLYIYPEYVYEPLVEDCKIRNWYSPLYGGIPIPEDCIYYSYENNQIVEFRCADCTAAGGRPINELPDDWPYQYPTEDRD